MVLLQLHGTIVVCLMKCLSSVAKRRTDVCVATRLGFYAEKPVLKASSDQNIGRWNRLPIMWYTTRQVFDP